MSLQILLRPLLPLLLATPVAVPQETQDDLVRARHLERVTHDPATALTHYTQAAANPSLLATSREEAFLGTIRCLLKLGRLDDALNWKAALPAGLNAKSAEPAVQVLLAEYLPTPGQNNPSVLGPRVQGLIDALSGEKSQDVTQSLIQLGDLVEPYLVAAVRTTTNPEVRAKVIHILGMRLTADPPGMPTIQFLNTLDPTAEPVLALDVLRNVRSHPFPAAAYPFLDRCVATQVPGMRKLLANFMAHREEEAADQFILALIDEPDPILRNTGMYAGMRGHPKLAVRVVERLDQMPDGELRMDAAGATEPVESRFAWLAACGSADVNAAAKAMSRWKGAPPLKELCMKHELDRLAGDFVRVASSPELDPEARADLFALNSAVSSRGGVVTSVVYGQEPRHGYLLELPLRPASLVQMSRLSVPSGRRSGHYSGPVAALLFRLDEPGMAEACLAGLDDAEFRSRVLDDEDPYEDAESQEVIDTWHRILTRCIELEGLDSKVSWSLLSKWLAIGKPGANAVARQFFEANPADERFQYVVPLFVEKPDECSEADLARWLVDPKIAAVSRDEIMQRLEKAAWARDSWPITDALMQVARNSSTVDLRERALRVLESRVERDRWLDLVYGMLPLPKGTPERAVTGLANRLADLTLDDKMRAVGELNAIFANMSEPALSQFGPALIQEASNEVMKHSDWRESFCEFLVPLQSRTDLQFAGRSVGVKASEALLDIWRGDYKDEWVASWLAGQQWQILVNTLGRMSMRQVLHHRDAVEALLTHDAESVRAKAIEALSQVLDVRTGTVLVNLLQDPSPLVREKALATLQRIRTYLEERERWAALGSGDAATLSPLGALLQQARDESPAIRLPAIRSLGALGDPAALPHLIELLRSDDAGIREAAQASIDALLERS